MRKRLVALAALLALAGCTPAQRALLNREASSIPVAYSVHATCEDVTVSVPAGSRAIIGLDMEPPYELAGETATYNFDPTIVDHAYMVDVIDATTGEQTHFVRDSVDGCPG